MIGRHRIGAGELDLLAGAGDGDGDGDDAAAVRLLRRAQHSRRLLALRAVLDNAADRHPAASRSACTEEAFALLSRTQQKAPASVEAVLLHPFVGSWAAACLRQMSDAAEATAAVATGLRYLGSIAASAALHAGQDFELPVPVHGDRVVLPTLGSARLPRAAPGASGVARLRRTAEGTTLVRGPATLVLPDDLGRDAPGWRAVRRLWATVDGQRLTVTLDDVDPYRSYPGLTPATVLADPAVARWRDRLAESWELLVRHHGALARTVAEGLSVLVPLDGATGTSVSGTSSDAFGAAAVSLPATAAELALAMVHEVQHSKLGALLDLVPLCRGPSDDRFYAPWRDDPRPVGGMLHGCYAYLAVTRFWREQRQVAAGPEAGIAHMEFARWREQTWRAGRRLSGSGLLTAPGRRFVAAMCSCLDRWRSEHVPAVPRDAARVAALDHELSWRLRNLRPDEATVALLAHAWGTGHPCPIDVGVRSDVLSAAFSPVEGPRIQLLRQRLRDPGRFRSSTAALAARPADVRLVSGDHAAAAEAYRRAIRTSGSLDDAAWVGLALARAAAQAVGRTLWRRPEVVVAVHREIGATSGVHADPDELARWLAPIAG